MIQINIGCGNDYKEGWVNIDKSECVKHDLILDMEKDKLPFKDNEASLIMVIDVLEHLHDLKNIMNECWRVLNKEGQLYVEVPYAGSFDDYKDPTHVRHFIPETFYYFERWNLNPAYELKKWGIVNSRFTKEERENGSRIFVTLTPEK